jgi:hypothetical protein
MGTLLQTSSDDQTALIGCAAALLAAGLILAISYYLSPVRRQDRGSQMRRVERPEPLQIPRDRAA